MDQAQTTHVAGADGENRIEGSLWAFRMRRTGLRLLQPLIAARDAWMFGDHLRLDSGQHAVARAEQNVRQPFFILGSPRSGTTMLREIINRHSDVFIPPENGALQGMIRAYGSMRKAPWNEVVNAVIDRFADGYEARFWALDLDWLKKRAIEIEPSARSLGEILNLIYRAYGEQNAPGKSCWADKSTPGHFEYLSKLDKVFPAARYVHIVRDGRDCVLSCVRTGFYGQSAVKAAYAWADNNRSCRRFGMRCGAQRFLQLQYEDLVQDPERELRRALRFLDLDFEPRMLDHSAGSLNASPDVKALAHHQNVLQPVSTASVGKWRSELPAACLSRITPILAPELKIHGYKTN